MRRIRDRVAGLDVHRDSVTACAQLFDGREVETEKKRFATTVAGVRELGEWLAEREVELVLMEAQVDAAAGALAQIGPPVFDADTPYFARQVGTTCMSTSLANGIISLGEPFLTADPNRRVPLLTEDVVDRTSAFGKPGEYRSVDDLFKYLESGKLLDVHDGDEGFSADYAVRLTCSLIDVIEALWTGEARLVIQRSAHAHLGYAIDAQDDSFMVRFRDPMMRSGPGFNLVSLEILCRDYMWSPLKKIPRLMGPHAFNELSAEELIGHLERYTSMENLGVDCPSALLYRRAEAPELHTPPEDEETAGPEVVASG